MGRALVFALFSTFACSSQAQFTFAPVNVSGAVATVARGISNSGEVLSNRCLLEL